MGMAMTENLCKSLFVATFGCCWVIARVGAPHVKFLDSFATWPKAGPAREGAWQTGAGGASLLSGSFSVSSCGGWDGSHGVTALAVAVLGLQRLLGPRSRAGVRLWKPLVGTDSGPLLAGLPFLLLQPIDVTNTCISSSLFEIPANISAFYLDSERSKWSTDGYWLLKQMQMKRGIETNYCRIVVINWAFKSVIKNG